MRANFFSYLGAWKAPDNDTMRVVFRINAQGHNLTRYDYVVVKLFGPINALLHQDRASTAPSLPEEEVVQIPVTVKFWHGDVERTIAQWRTSEPCQPTIFVVDYCLDQILEVLKPLALLVSDFGDYEPLRGGYYPLTEPVDSSCELIHLFPDDERDFIIRLKD